MVSKAAITRHAVTSIILATIMVAGGVTFAIPGAIPEAAAQSSNANLYVSAENPAFDNFFSGLNVVEVVVRDSDINDRGDSDDQPSGEPRVEVDGSQLRMVQGNDGNWYGYFAHDTIMMADTEQIINYGVRSQNPDTIIDGGFSTDNVYTDADDVIRTMKEPNTAAGLDNRGSVRMAENVWPIIQVFNFDDADEITVEYSKGGNPQSVTLTYDGDDMDDYASLTLDQDRYAPGADVIMTMTDLAMNVDPTDEDVWTFTTENGNAYYRLFDDSSPPKLEGDGIRAYNQDKHVDMIDKTVSGIDDNFDLAIDVNANDTPVIGFADTNQDRAGKGLPAKSVTFVETSSNTGVFTNIQDGNDRSSAVVLPNAERGTSAVITYNDGDVSVVVGRAFATIVIDDDSVGGVWNSGEEVTVTLTDADVNKNTMNDEDIAVNDEDFTIIPSVRIGSPITLADVERVEIVGVSGDMDYLSIDDDNVGVDDFSDVLRMKPSDMTNVKSIMFMNIRQALSYRTF